MMNTINKPEFTNMRSLIEATGKALNLINRDMEHHNEQTAYLTYHIANAMGLSGENLNLALYAGLLHDIGAIMIPGYRNLYETEQIREQVAKAGSYMLRELDWMKPIADVIASVQNNYDENLQVLEDGDLLDITQAVRLADYIATILKDDLPIISQVKGILEQADDLCGTEFGPKAVDALHSIAGVEYIWLDCVLHPTYLGYFTGKIQTVDLAGTLAFTQFISKVIDYRSSFTAMHSAGVAATARELARLAGMSPDEVQLMEIAGNLHDIGKLRVPNEILEKHGKLTEAEFNIMREHTYYTYQILAPIEGFDEIAKWAAFHHEKLNGKGYPFHLNNKQLDIGSRIMAVADIFSAITEVRPYRQGMDRNQAQAVLKGNVERGEICGWVVDLLLCNYDEVDAVRERESRIAGRRYFQALEMQQSEKMREGNNK